MPNTTQYIQNLVKDSLDSLDLPDQVVSEGMEIVLERPTNQAFGDYSTNVAMSLFSQLKTDKNGLNQSQLNVDWLQNPRALATHLSEQLQHSSLYDSQKISAITVAGPGFINFTLAPEFLLSLTQEISTEPEKSLAQTGNNRKVIVEYSSPNIAKPFTVGHLRSTIIGDAVANILAATGWQVFRDNHLGDWGTQFGKQIYAIKTWGDETEIDQAEHPVKKLVELYVKFHEEAEKDPSLEDQGRAWFKKLEDGDQEARELWQKCIDWSWKEFQRVYQELDVSFTENDGRGYGESYFEDKMGSVLEELRQKGLMKEGENGAQLVFYPNEEYPPLMILKKDGATLYSTRDLATDKWRLGQYGQDVVVINEVGAEQATYFRQLYKLEDMLGWFEPGQRIHVKHGLYRFKDKKMSTRKGNVIWLEDVLTEAEKRANDLATTKQAENQDKNHSTSAENGKAIGIGALKWNDLKRSSHLDVVFDWDEIVNLKGNSGPYLQYTFVRCQSILAKANDAKSDSNVAIPVQIDTLSNSLVEAEKTIMRELAHFDETVQLAAKEYAPHYVCTYLYQLAQSFNTFYTQCSVLGPDVSPESRQVRLALTQAVSQVLALGLGMLGIKTVEQM